MSYPTYVHRLASAYMLEHNCTLVEAVEHVQAAFDALEAKISQLVDGDNDELERKHERRMEGRLFDQCLPD